MTVDRVADESGAASVPNHLEWPGCVNARDLGGLPVVGGGRIRHRALVRSEQLNGLTAAGSAAFGAYGFGRILDLRAANECAAEPGPFAAEPAYRNVPLPGLLQPRFRTWRLADIYLHLLDESPESFAAAVAAVATAPPGPVLVHCAAGKDRTGLVVGLTLAVVGAVPSAIAADYALTAERLKVGSAEYIAGLSDPAEREHVQRLASTPPEHMLRVLSHLEAEYGGVEAYLAAGGLSANDLAAIRDRLKIP